MGYLRVDVTNTAFTMNKASVSAWFKIPAGSLADATARDSDFSGNLVVFKCVPVLMWGEQTTGDTFNTGSSPMGPSWIGVTNLWDQPTVEVNIQTNDLSSFSDGNEHPTVENFPVWFGNSNQNPLICGSPGPATVDVWHHLLMSWELSHNESAHGEGIIDGASKIYCVLDGANKSGIHETLGPLLDDLPAFCPQVAAIGTGGPNDMITAPGTLGASDPLITSSVSISKIPFTPIMIPGFPVINRAMGAAQNLSVQLGRLEIFSGVVYNQSHIAAFIQDGKPTPLATSSRLLGRKPHIRFATAADYTEGRNTGSLGSGATVSKVGTISTVIGEVGL